MPTKSEDFSVGRDKGGANKPCQLAIFGALRMLRRVFCLRRMPFVSVFEDNGHLVGGSGNFARFRIIVPRVHVLREICAALLFPQMWFLPKCGRS